MSSQTWTAFAVKPQSEGRAEDDIRRQGCASFKPVETRRRRIRGKERTLTRLMLPGYIFANAEGLDALGNSAESPFAALVQAGVDASSHHRHHEGTLGGSMGRNEWIASGLRASIDESNARLQSGLSVLASVSSTAPFVGLFGTVWGIYHALVAIGLAGQASLDKVAGPVGEALIMTALGLAVAIPAALGYNALVRGNKSLVAKLNRFGYDLHAFFLTGSRVGDGAAPAGGVRDPKLTAVTGAKA